MQTAVSDHCLEQKECVNSYLYIRSKYIDNKWIRTVDYKLQDSWPGTFVAVWEHSRDIDIVMHKWGKRQKIVEG